MKKILLISMICLMLVSLVGCGKKDDNKNEFVIGNKSNVQISKNVNL